MSIKRSMSLDELEDMPEYQVGSWRSPYVKIYSIGGQNRIAEISNYPRAYKDTELHVYTEDVSFIVTKDELNHEEEGEQYYKDSKGDLYRIGEKATHWAGDVLAGAFPLWIESEDLPFIADAKEHVFSLDKVPAPIVQLVEAELKVGTSYVKVLPSVLDGLVNQVSSGEIVLLRRPQDLDRQIIRIRYRRVF